MGIARHCQPSDQEYIEASQYIKESKYHHALANLQRLVIQHLFKLNKLNITATGELISIINEVLLIYLLGYCMCTHIAKSLQTYCKAIQNAVQTYNTAATEMSPPLPLS